MPDVDEDSDEEDEDYTGNQTGVRRSSRGEDESNLVGGADEKRSYLIQRQEKIR